MHRPAGARGARRACRVDADHAAADPGGLARSFIATRPDRIAWPTGLGNARARVYSHQAERIGERAQQVCSIATPRTAMHAREC